MRIEPSTQDGIYVLPYTNRKTNTKHHLSLKYDQGLIKAFHTEKNEWVSLSVIFDGPKGEARCQKIKEALDAVIKTDLEKRLVQIQSETSLNLTDLDAGSRFLFLEIYKSIPIESRSQELLNKLFNLAKSMGDNFWNGYTPFPWLKKTPSEVLLGLFQKSSDLGFDLSIYQTMINHEIKNKKANEVQHATYMLLHNNLAHRK